MFSRKQLSVQAISSTWLLYYKVIAKKSSRPDTFPDINLSITKILLLDINYLNLILMVDRNIIILKVQMIVLYDNTRIAF